MSKHDGLLQVDGAPTPLMRVLLSRRSVRKYEAQPASEDQVRYILDCESAFRNRVGFTSPRILVVARGDGGEQVIRAATKGVLGKINPWLPFTKATHLLLCCAVYPEGRQRRGVERAIAEASMTMEVAVLAATEVGLGTCWMAGIDHERVEAAFPMPDGARLIAISTLGTAPSRLRLSWDAVAYHLVSKRRKPMEQLWMSERWKGEA